MNCRAAEARLFAGADHTLALEAQLELDAHVHDCARCAALARELAALADALARTPAPPLDALDVDAHVRAVRAALDAGAETRPVARRWTPWLVSAAAAAAALIALLWLTRTSPRPVDRLVDDAPRDAAAGEVSREVVDELRPTTEPPADVATTEERPAPDAPSVADGAHTAPGAEHATGAPDAAIETSPLAAPPALTDSERARWEAARSALASALVAALESSRDAGREALAAEFATRTLELRRATWPVARLAEGLAVDAPPDVARAALRYLGVHGDRSNVRALQRALATPELAFDAALALADLGEIGGETAADALVTLAPAPRDAALARIASARDARAAAWLETLVRRALRPRGSDLRPRESDLRPRESDLRPRGSDVAADDETRSEFARRALASLPQVGAPATESLLRLGESGADAAEVLARLQMTPGAARELARVLERTPRAYSAEFLIAVVERLRPQNGVEWLAARAHEGRGLRPAAIAALARWDETGAARALVALHTSGRIERPVLTAALGGLVERAPEVAADLVRTCTHERDRVALQILCGDIAGFASGACTPALVALAESEFLPRSDRKSALLEAGELARADDAASFMRLFRELDPRERELRAACVLPLHRLGGEDALRELLPRANARALERLCALLADPAAVSRPTTTLIRVTQELDDVDSRAAP